MKKTIACILLFAAAYNIQAQQVATARAKELVGKMTLEEKAGLLVGNGLKMPGNQAEGPVIGQTQDKVPGAAGTTFAIPRLGVPSLVVSDGPAGVRIDPFRKGDSAKSYYATAWPVGTLLASTWDTALVKKMAVAFGSEAHEYGIDIILGPALNIHRNPLGGRNFEYFSEDPVVAGNMTAAIVNGIQSNGVGTSIKHFAANNQETNRNTVNTILSERALREIYLKGFQIAVGKSHPWTVMSSYNMINGTYTSQEYDLLTTILRKEWGFKGLVVSDWFGGKDPVAQMKAGNDLLMPGTPQQTKTIIEAVKNGTLDEKILTKNAGRLIDLVLQSPSSKNYKFSDKPDLPKHAQISRTVAAEGMVLLKNEDEVLPISKSIRNIALFGINGYELIAGGTGSGDVNKLYTVSIEKGLSNAGYNVDGDLKNRYINYIGVEKSKHPKKSFFEEFLNPTPPIPKFPAEKENINKKAAEAGIAVVVIGRNAGEGNDRKLENDFDLSDIEKTLIKNVADAFHAKNKKLIVVLNIGGVIEIASWRDQADGILLAWQPGMEGGNAITDLLTGKVNPSGKLATTFPINYDDVPSAKNFPGKEFPEKGTTGNFGMKQIPAEVTYDEGIYVGYRYFDTYNVKTAYDFGYGLSYTKFSYGKLKVSSPAFQGKLTASLTVTNTGNLAGKEIIQIYVTAPSAKLDKPGEELKAFAKTRSLKPGESETLRFNIYPGDLASFDTHRSSWIADAGKYIIKAGASCHDIKQSAGFTLSHELVVEKCHNVLAPQITINELKGH
ncbi:MAG: glycoside hydrolase family 3 C-terminal domain-containing protein [Ginsengibacter sp.]